MIDDESVRLALTTLERCAPDEAEVLAGLRTGIAGRRRRRQVASVLGVAATAALVGVGVVLVAPSRGTDQPAAPPGQPTPGPSAPARPAPVAAAPPVLPFTPGWLPQGYQLDAWEADGAGGFAQYVGAKDFQTVVVLVNAAPREAVEGATDTPATVAGRPGTLRRLAPDQAETQLIWQRADGRWVMVGGRAPTVSLDMLRHVAETLTETPTALAAPLRLPALPAGYPATSWAGGRGSAPASLSVCRSAGGMRGASANDCINVTVSTGALPPTVPTARFDHGNVKQQVLLPLTGPLAVNGRQTWVVADPGAAAAAIDANHWVLAMGQKADLATLRAVVAAVTLG